uniref:Uncharacterized protein n=1 Tax=Rhizophora mucronata TaxID=61149 RepID=A0A2P2P5Y1_RHIMU
MLDAKRIKIKTKKRGCFLWIVLRNFCRSRLVEFRCFDFPWSSFVFGSLFIHLLFAHIIQIIIRDYGMFNFLGSKN